MPDPIRVLHYGLGSIGRRIARLGIDRGEMVPVGAVDTNPDLTGRDLGELLDLETPLGVLVVPDAETLLNAEACDLVLHATSSRLHRVEAQIESIVEAGLSVISTCEEMVYPWWSSPQWSSALDRRAKDLGVSVLACGINPGFVLDLLPLVLTGLCARIDSIEIRRVIDLTGRSETFQARAGVGMTREAFEQARLAEEIGHVGLAESAWMLGDTLGWPIEDVLLDPPQPVMRDDRIVGVRQRLTARQGERLRIRFEYEMSDGAENPGDRIRIDGEPPVELSLNPVRGDAATAALVVHTARRLMSDGVPGLLTVKDLPPAAYCDASDGSRDAA